MIRPILRRWPPGSTATLPHPVERDKIIASFHWCPKAYLEKGDPDHRHCQKTTRLLGEATGSALIAVTIAFQSRFGRAEWLKLTAETVAKLANSGTRNLVVISPGFASDCVETLEEIAIGVREIFHANGGENFSMVPCLNDSPEFIELLAGLIRRELGLGIRPAPTARRKTYRFSAILPSRGGSRAREQPMFEGSSVFALVFLALVVITIFQGIRTVPQGYNYTVERFGRYIRTL